MIRFPIISASKGFTLVETMAAIVVLSMVALMVFAGIQGSLGISRTGKRKAEAVAILKAVTEEISGAPLLLEQTQGRGEQVYSAESIAVSPSYEARYSVAKTAHGVYRLEVRVMWNGNEVASNTVLVQALEVDP